MNGYGHERTTPSVEDGDGVRVIREPVPVMPAATVLKLLAAAVLVAGIAVLVLSSRSSRVVAGSGDEASVVPATSAAAATPTAGTRRVTTTARAPQRRAAASAGQRDAAVQDGSVARSADDLPSGDPNDIATYVSPGDPVPTMTEVIQGLHDIGDHTGIGAFNPPGTSPPLVGLAVPEDFALPPGYVRHHQVTDEGEPLEAILMFSPDGVFVDASGREIAIPEDRVVPPGMAPPGLPIREITIPPTP